MNTYLTIGICFCAIHILLVDRVYLGHLGDGDSLALTGVGLTFPIVTLSTTGR